MSDIVEIIRSSIVGIPQVSSLVSSRIYPDVLPQNATLPAVVLTAIDGIGVMHLGGVSGVKTTRVQVDSYGDRRSQANDVDEQIRLSLLRHPSSTYVDETVDRVMDAGHRDLPAVAPRDGSQGWQYTRQHDYLVTHDEAIP